MLDMTTMNLKQYCNHPHWGSKWRELDFKILESDEFKKRLRKRNIILVKWGQIKEVLYD